MTGALFFLLLCGLKNRVVSRLRKLRRPKYLISALAGLAYLYFIFHNYASLHKPDRTWGAPDPGLLLAVEIGFGCLLMLTAVYYCFFPGTTRLFDEPEMQFLFPAPISRIALLHYRIAKGQLGVLFGTLMTFIVTGAIGIFRNPGFLLIGLWTVYTFLNLYRIAVWLAVRTPGGQRAWGWVLKGLILAAASSAVWTYLFVPPPGVRDLSMTALLAWLFAVADSGPLQYLLYPFRMLVRPALSAGPAQFASDLAPALAILVTVYFWIRGCKKGIEGTVVAQWRELSPEIRPPAGRPVLHPPFDLSPEGSAHAAIFWKNLSLAGRFRIRRALPFFVVLVAGFILTMKAFDGEAASAIAGSMSAALAGFLTLFGPILFREDLRTDMKYIGLLKTYPIPGWRIVLGEALAPAAILLALQWALILIAASVLPDVEEIRYTTSQRISFGAAAALLLPSLGFIGILVQNAVVLLLPGWVYLGREHQQGVEAMGQRLITSIATAVSLLVAALPAAILFAVVFVAGFPFIGQAMIPVASLAAAVVLLAEAATILAWLGRLFDRFDPSKEILDF